MKITCSKGIHFHSYEPMSAWRCRFASLAALHLNLSDCNAEVKQVLRGFQPDQWSHMIRSTCCHDKEFDWLERLIQWFFQVDHSSEKKGIGQSGAFTCQLVESILIQKKYQSKIWLLVIVIYRCVGECEWEWSRGIVFIGISWRINPSLFVINVSFQCHLVSMCSLSSCPFRMSSANRRPSETVFVSYLRLLLGRSPPL